MNRDFVRLIVGVAVILTHLFAFFGIVVLKSKYIPAADERLDLAMVLIPVSAGYFVAVVRSAIQNQNVSKTARYVNLNYTVIVLLVTLAFCFALLYFVYSYPAIVGPTIVELRRWLVVLEIGFGGGFGLIAEDLFGKVEKVLIRQEEQEPTGAVGQ
jgi:Kef-type K+ transport system membrane component KefB